ncbi:hypothetical protein [Rhizobium sp. FKY42]|uniref:hypothetical protein n=1 Tax=Rhizobium sp. FKY42 TaxID=2562310 RepID=UPI0010C111C2|nr:hypothetical protein [Rhizobium sp. FKY42]
MAKKTVAAPAARERTGVTTYQVSEGVTLINGKKVEGKTVELTPAEALYDLSLGRLIDPKPKAEAPDGGN